MGSSIVYPQAGPRKNWDKHGERVSLLDYMAVFPDAATAFNQAITHGVTARGGLSIQVPTGTYILNSPVLFNKPNILIYGEGSEASIFKRGADMPNGVGMFHITSSFIKFRDLGVEGSVTTSATLLYSAFAFDPMNVLLTKNTSFWVKGSGASTVEEPKFDHVTIRHTGGYAILFDSTTGPILKGRVLNCLFENNRPHTFGFISGDEGYGSWTGGVHYQGDGSLFGVVDLLVENSTFSRNTGNCVWGHLYGFTTIHYNVRVKGSHFSDCGLDGVLMGGVSSGIVSNNTFRRIGYVCSDDTSPGVPKLLPNANAVAMDTSGFVMGVNYVNNTSVSANGGHLDLDGLTQSTVANNTCRTPRNTDPEYVEDQIGLSGWGGSSTAGGANFAYGINTGNSSRNQGGEGLTIVGNRFINLCGGSIRLYAGRYCTVSDNDVFAPPNSLVAPIVMGNTDTQDNRRSYGNVVEGNRIDYSPTASGAAIYEDGSISPFNASDANWVYNNKLTGTGSAIEFQKDPVTQSVTRTVHTSNFGNTTDGRLLVNSTHFVQREGRASDFSSVLRWYLVEGTTQTLNMQLQGFRLSGVQEPLLNVSAAGAVHTGVYATGNRTQAVFGDCIVTGKLYGDSMLCLTDTTFLSGDLALLPVTVATMRYISATGALQTSFAAPSGSRQVFSQLSSESTLSRGFVNTLGTSVFWQSGLKFAPWSPGSVLVINGLPYAVASVTNDSTIVLATAPPTTTGGAWNLQSPLFNVSANGAAYTGTVTTGNRGTSAFDDSVVTGKVYADSLFAIASTTYNDNDANFLPATVGLIRYKLVGSAWQFQTSTTVTSGVRDWLPLASGTGTSLDKQVLYNKAGVTAGDSHLMWDYNGTALALTITGLTGTSGLNVLTSYIASDQGFTTPSTSYQAIQAPAGGLLVSGIGVTNASAKGGYIDIPPIGYATFPAPLVSASFGATDVLLWSCGTNGTVTPLTTIGLNTNAFINAAVGFVTGNAAYNSIQSPNGGVLSAGAAVSPLNSAGGYIGINPLNYGSGGFPTPLTPLGSFGSTTVLLWAGATNLTVTPPTGLGLITNAFINAAVGFVTGNNAYNSIQSPTGGMIAAGLGITDSASKGGYIGINPLSYGGGLPYPAPLTPLGSFGSTTALLWASGTNGTGTTGQPLALTTIGIMSNAYINAAAGFVTAAPNFNAIQATVGGMYAKLGYTSDQAVYMITRGVTVPNTPGAGYGALAYKSGTQFYYYDSTALAWKIADFTAGSAAGSTSWVQYNTGGLFDASTHFTYTAAAQAVTITGITATAGLSVLTSYIASDQGFVTTSTNFQSIQSLSGGVSVAGAGVVPNGGLGGYIGINPLNYGSGTFPLPLAPLGSFGSTTVLLWAGSSNGTVTPPSGLGLITNAYVNAAVGFVTGNNTYNSIQSPTGGLLVSGIGVTNTSAKGGYIDIPSISYATFPTPLVNASFGGTDVLLWSCGANGTATPLTTIGLNTNAFINASAGFVTAATNFNAVQATAGGMYAKLGFTSDQAVYLISRGSTVPNTPGSGYGAWAYKSGTQFYFYDSSAVAWKTFDTAGALAAGSDTWMQYNKTGAFGADASLAWNYSFRVLSITTSPGVQGLMVYNGFVQTEGGFVTTATSYQAIQAPTGGLYVSGIGVTNSSAKGGYIDIPPISYSTFPTPLVNASFGGTDVLLWSCGANGTSAPLTTIGLNTNAFVNAAAGFVTASANFNAIQATLGGMYAKLGFTSDQASYLIARGAAVPNTPGAGYGAWAYKSSTQFYFYDSTAASWKTFDTASTLASGSTGWVQFSGGSGVFSASSNLAWNTVSLALTINGVSNTPGLNVLNGYISSDGGFASAAGTSFQTVNIPNGGGLFAGIGVTNSSNKGGYIDLPPIAYANFPTPLASASFASTDVLLWSGTANGTVTVNTSRFLMCNAAINAANGFVTGGSADNIIQAPSGGIAGRRLISTFDIAHTGISSSVVTLPTGATGQGKLYFDVSPGTGVGKWMVIQGTNAAVAMIGAGGSPGGLDTYIQYNGPQGTGGTFSGSSNHTWNDSLHRMSVFGVSNTAAIFAGTGYIQSDGGFLVTNTNTSFNSIQTSGGVTSLKAFQVGPFYTADRGAAANGFLVHTESTNTSGVIMDVYDTTGSNPFILPTLIGRKLIGTPGTGVFGNVPNNSFLFSFGARGSTTSGPTVNASAKINVMATENWSTIGNGAELQFATSSNGTTSGAINRMYIRQQGFVEVMTSLYAHSGLQTDAGLYAITLGTSATPGTPGGGYAALGHRSGSTWWYYNPTAGGWAFVDFAASGGVTSLNTLTGVLSIFPGTGISSIVTGTGSITINLPQAMFSFSDVNFNSVNVPAGYKISGTTVINSSGQFVGPGIDVGRFNGVGCRGVNPYDSGGASHTGQDTTISGHTFIGGICVT